MRKIVFLFMTFVSTFVYGQRCQNYLLSYEDKDSLGYEIYGYKATTGEIAIKAKYGLIATDTLCSIAFVVVKGGWVAIDRNENTILYPFIFDNGPDYVVEGLFRFVENGKVGFANIDGIKIIPATFDYAEPFENGLAKYIMGGCKKYIDGGEHWLWDGGYETGYIDKLGHRVKE